MATTSSITDPISNRDAIGSVDSADSILIVDATDGVVKKATVSQLPSGSGVSDGDKGDITVSASGATWTIDAGVVGTSKLGGDITTAGKALLDDADNAAQRTTLGLGTAATANTGDFAAASHTHNASDINAGTIDTARLGSGTANSTTYLRGDQTWASVAASSVLTTQGDVLYHNGTGDTRLPAGTVGQVLQTYGTGANPVWGDAWIGVHLAADQTWTSQTTLQNTNLTFNTGTTGTFSLRMVAFGFTGNATMDYKFGTAFTGVTTTVSGVRRYIAAGAAAGTDNENTLPITAQIASASVAATTTGVFRVEIEMNMVVTTAGTWTFKVAQNTSDAGTLRLYAGSYVEWRKVA